MGTRFTKVRFYKRRNGTAVPSHQRKINTKDNPQDETTKGPSPQLLTNEKPPLVFPDPQHIPPPLSFMKTIKRNMSEEKLCKKWTLPHSGNETTDWYWTNINLNKNGIGQIKRIRSIIESRSVGHLHTQKIGPKETISDKEITHNINLSHINLSDGKLSAPTIEKVKLDGAQLPNVIFTSEEMLRTATQTFQEVSFDGANLQGAIYNNPRFRNVSFRGANISDVRFMNPHKIEPHYTIDFTNSNITAEQYDSLAHPTERSNNIIINKYSIDDFAAFAGETPDTIATLAALGGIETRDRTTNQPVEPGTGFDSEKHYIPQWVAQTYNR